MIKNTLSGAGESPDREAQEGTLAALRAALIAGERSGPYAPFDFEAFIARKRASRRQLYDTANERR
jgi:Arc/MetJ-type ribon-helix-helix transcriptional regulator